MVVFTFQSNNHTATQSTFDTPCDPLAGGMDSGFMPNPMDSINPAPQVAMQVMVTTPLCKFGSRVSSVTGCMIANTRPPGFYCRQANHCGQGMTFSINPTLTNTQALFQAKAIQQKGAGKGSAITGNAGAQVGNGTAAAPAAPPAAAPAVPATPAGASAAPAAPAAAAPITQGTGTIQNGQCVCAVACGVGAFPAAAAQGLSAFGGMPGALPASMVEA